MLYNPSLFREDRPEVLAGLIHAVQFAALITPTAEGLQISHAPTILKHGDGPCESWTLESHIARPNPHRLAMSKATGETVAVFQGPQAYVSPSWYPSKPQHGKVVPTWNYAIVHVHGTLETVDDERWLLDHITDLTDANEAARAKPWDVSDAPADYIAGLVKAILGLRLRVSRVEGKWKMSQNRNEADRDGVTTGLSQEGAAAAGDVAQVMRKLEQDRQR